MQLKMFGASIESVLLRFALLMAMVIIGMFTHQDWLMLLALPVFISALLAISFKFKKATKTADVPAKKLSMEH